MSHAIVQAVFSVGASFCVDIPFFRIFLEKNVRISHVALGHLPNVLTQEVLCGHGSQSWVICTSMPVA